MAQPNSATRTRWFVAAAVALVLAVLGIAWGMTHRYQAPSVPGVAASTRSSTTVTQPATPAGTPAESSSGVPAPTASHSASNALPVQVNIPALKVTSALLHLGLNPDGTMAVPSDAQARQAAWFTGSPTPGSAGPAVIEAHVTAPGGPGPFYSLATMRTGDQVSVRLSDGRTVRFEVYQVSRYPKDAFPTGEVYGNTTGPELRLITCGGQFDRSTGHFEDNTVVYARQA